MQNARTKRIARPRLQLLVLALILGSVLTPATAAPQAGALATIGYLEVTTSRWYVGSPDFCLVGRIVGTLVFAGKPFIGSATLGGAELPGDCSGVRSYDNASLEDPVWNSIVVELRGNGLSGQCSVGWPGRSPTNLFLDCSATVGNGVTGLRTIRAHGINNVCGSGSCKPEDTTENIYRGVA